MALVRVPGGMWAPRQTPGFWAGSPYLRGNFGLVDADAEEYQIIGRVVLAGGPGSTKTFGTTSKIGWLGGAANTFIATSTLRVGVKKSSTIDAANGPPARATAGTAAFDVYKDLVGGTDTLASVGWNSATMASGTNFTVAQGDLIAVCFCLSITSGAQSINFSAHGNSGVPYALPTATLITAGLTYTVQNCLPMCVLTFEDGTFGWIDGSFISSDSPSQTNVGNTNIYGNVIRLPFDCKVDAIGGLIVPAGTTNFDFGLYSTPAGTPTAMSNGTISVDPQILGDSAGEYYQATLPAEVALTANTDYFLAVKQNSATAIAVQWYDVNAATDFQSNGLDANTYAALSTAGGSVAAANSGKRRAALFLRVSQINDTAGGTAGMLYVPDMAGT